MYSVYNRSIPVSFQNTLYCGTEARQNDTAKIKSENHFFMALLLLLLFSLS